MIVPQFSTGVLFATTNVGKLREISLYGERLGFEVGDPTKLVSSLGAAPVVAEVASSYEGNAQLKARAFSRWAGKPCLADDAGIEVARLSGLPGVFTSRWGLDRVAGELAPFRRSAALFVCAMSFADSSGRVVTTRGTLEGELRMVGDAPRALNAPLPFSDFFYVRGYNEPLSALVKRGLLVSHRYIALRALLKALG
jgi:XTP/dITP diphosphohydrolase